MLGSAEATVRGSVQLARVAFAGALTRITGITIAVVMIAGASAEGADASPVVTRAVATATVGPLPGRRDGLCRVACGCWIVDTAQRGLRALDRHRGTTRRACLLRHVLHPHRRPPPKTACLATATLSASSRSRAGRSLPALRDAARWRPLPASCPRHRRLVACRIGRRLQRLPDHLDARLAGLGFDAGPTNLLEEPFESLRRRPHIV